MADSEVGRVTLFHPSGAQVLLPVFPTEVPTPKEWAERSFKFVDAYLAAGFLAQAPGLVEGETKFPVGYIVRREFEDTRDGNITPVLDVYSAVEGQNKFKVVKVYLNTDEEIAAFERASGMKLTDMQIYVGTGDIERGKSTQLDRLVNKVKKPFSAVYIPNPKYDEAAAKAAKPGEYMIPRRKWVRWEGSSASAETQTKGQEMNADIDKEVKWWRSYIDKDPALAELNDHIRRLLIPMKNKEAKAMVWEHVIKPWTELTNAEWDSANQAFVLPKPPEEEPDYGPGSDEGAPF